MFLTQEKPPGSYEGVEKIEGGESVWGGAVSSGVRLGSSVGPRTDRSVGNLWVNSYFFYYPSGMSKIKVKLIHKRMKIVIR